MTRSDTELVARLRDRNFKLPPNEQDLRRILGGQIKQSGPTNEHKVPSNGCAWSEAKACSSEWRRRVQALADALNTDDSRSDGWWRLISRSGRVEVEDRWTRQATFSVASLPTGARQDEKSASPVDPRP